MTVIDLFENVAVPTVALYLAVNVVLPAVRPET